MTRIQNPQNAGYPARTLFYHLLRAALWADRQELVQAEVEAVRAMAPTPELWKRVYRMAEDQATLGLVSEAVEHLPEELMPPREMLLAMAMLGNRTRQSHSLLNRALRGMTAKLDALGVRSVLLKGQGLSLDYAVPRTRQCGDLDIWVGEVAYGDVCRVLEKEGIEADYALGSVSKHLNFEFDGVDVEVHRLAATLLYSKKNEDFNAWTAKSLGGTRRCMWVTEDLKVSESGQEGAVKVLLPPVTYNSLYVFLHLFHHFVYGGVGLRQLCDWCRYLYVHSMQIDLPELEHRLHEYRLMGAWRLFGALCVQSLGLPEESMPFYSKNVRPAKLERLRSFIERDGNFGHAAMRGNPRPRGFVAGKWYSLRRQIGRSFSLLTLCPADVVFSLRHYLAHGIRSAWHQSKSSPR